MNNWWEFLSIIVSKTLHQVHLEAFQAALWHGPFCRDIIQDCYNNLLFNQNFISKIYLFGGFRNIVYKSKERYPGELEVIHFFFQQSDFHLVNG